MSEKDVLNTEEAAAFLGISPYDLRRYARRGMIPARKLGRRWLFHKGHLVEWLKGEWAESQEEEIGSKQTDEEM